MESVTVRHWDDLLAGVLMFVLCTGAGAWLSREGDHGALIVFGTLGVLFLMYFLYIGTKTETISAEGICARSVLKTQMISWQQVDKAGVAFLNLGWGAEPYLSITFSDPASLKYPLRSLRRKASKPGFLFRYRDDLCTAVEKFYGPLDFDQMAVSPEKL